MSEHLLRLSSSSLLCHLVVVGLDLRKVCRPLGAREPCAISVGQMFVVFSYFTDGHT